jgi:hypothetical protein
LQELLENVSTRHLPKHNIGKGFHVTGVYPLNENPVCEDEFLSSYVTDRIYIWVKDQAKASSNSKDNNKGGKSAGFMKVSPEIIRALPKDGPRKSGGRKHGKSRIPKDTPEKTENRN